MSDTENYPNVTVEEKGAEVRLYANPDKPFSAAAENVIRYRDNNPEKDISFVHSLKDGVGSKSAAKVVTVKVLEKDTTQSLHDRAALQRSGFTGLDQGERIEYREYLENKKASASSDMRNR